MREPDRKSDCESLISARRWAPDAEEWLPFLRDVLQLPPPMLAAVQSIIKKEWWERARDPLASVRAAAERAHIRKCLTALPAMGKSRAKGAGQP
jgi:hypothetical protein